tara:strand:+ start:279 stop:563 length:285 start_codon:yes stop_codon:yes gene_type:complete
MDLFNDDLVSVLMDTNELQLLLESNMENFIVLDENYFNLLVNYIYNNNLLILFCLSFFSTLYCCTMKNKKDNGYIRIKQYEPIEGKIINNDEKV